MKANILYLSNGLTKSYQKLIPNTEYPKISRMILKFNNSQMVTYVQNILSGRFSKMSEVLRLSILTKSNSDRWRCKQ